MIVIAAVDPECDDARLLVDELSAMLASVAGDSGPSPFPPQDARGPRARFVVACDAQGALLGCAALRPLGDHVGEIKRMYARRPGCGAGTALLAYIEQQALALGYRYLWLETRRINLRAVAFYTRHGYTPIPQYGQYVARDNAVCMGKELHGLP